MAFLHADITKVSTVGASFMTAEAERWCAPGEFDSDDGVKLSEKLASDDSHAMNNHKSKIVRVGRRKRVDPAIIAGIISRESRGGKAISNKYQDGKYGWGDQDPATGRYKAFGLMQIDTWPVELGGGGHTPVGEWDSKEHLEQATDILIWWIGRIREKFDMWTKERQLKGGIAAYNKGGGNIRKHKKMGHGWVSMPDGYTGDFDPDHSFAFVDCFTTGGDYSNDVVARAQWYTDNGY